MDDTLLHILYALINNDIVHWKIYHFIEFLSLGVKQSTFFIRKKNKMADALENGGQDGVIEF